MASEAALEEDLQSGDSLARSFLGLKDDMPIFAPTSVATSAFPFTCPGCDVTDANPITNLVNDATVQAVKSYSCTTGEDHTFVPYFPGIQGYNDAKHYPGPRTLLGGDTAVADLYVKFALRSSLDGSDSDIKGWSLLNYFNQSTPNKNHPGVPLLLSPPRGASPGRGARVQSRANHSSLRLSDDDTLPYREGDQVESRLLGIWASTPDDSEFIAQTPHFLAKGNLAARDARDFEHFRTNKDDPAWRDFMYRSAYEVAVAWKCGVPVFAHSGGGAVVAFLTRLLSVSALREEMASWKTQFRVIGLEAVLSEQMNQRMRGAFGHVSMQQYVVGSRGSETYTDVIAKECVEIGQTPLFSLPVTGNIDPPGWNGDGRGHGGIGFFTLVEGRLAGVPRFLQPL